MLRKKSESVFGLIRIYSLCLEVLAYVSLVDGYSTPMPRIVDLDRTLISNQAV